MCIAMSAAYKSSCLSSGLSWGLPAQLGTPLPTDQKSIREAIIQERGKEAMGYVKKGALKSH